MTILEIVEICDKLTLLIPPLDKSLSPVRSEYLDFVLNTGLGSNLTEWDTTLFTLEC